MMNPPIVQPILTAKAATGQGETFAVGYYSNIQLMLNTASSANFTLKVQGSFAATAPDFSSASSPTNPWFFVATWNLDSNALVAGATGIAATGTDLQQGLLVNVDGLQWMSAQITAWAAGAITVVGYANND